MKLSYRTPDDIFELLAFHLSFIASIIAPLHSLRTSKQGHGMMCARERQENK